MNFLNLHEDVIEGHILPLLEWNDLLRFRRVCKTTHEITTKYIRTHPGLAPEIGITEEDDKSFKAFLAMGIPTTKLFLDTEASGYRFYEKNSEDIDRFLKKDYGLLVKSLRVKEISLYMFGKEREFLRSLVNLESFEGDYFGAGTGTRVVNPYEFHQALGKCLEMAKKELGLEKEKLFFSGDSWGSLKKLKIGQKDHLPIKNILLRTKDAVENCPGLEYLGLPFNANVAAEDGIPQELAKSSLASAQTFAYLEQGILANLEMHQKVNLKVIDFANFHSDDFETYDSNAFNGSIQFPRLVKLCWENGIKMRNVGPIWYCALPAAPPELGRAELGEVILSLVNIKPVIFFVDLPNLTKIDIRNTSRCSTVLFPGQRRPIWPSLKSLDINVDSKVMATVEAGFQITHDTKNLFNFFFKDVERTALEELCLKFEEKGEQLAIPKTEDIVRACPNLKKLRIVNWPGTNKALTKLWSGLPGLEEVSLENCKQLGNVAFVGEDRENPVFLKLKNLKKLSLKGLDQMPKLSDTLFSLVIRHLNLTHFILTSNAPISSVSLAGVEALLTGPFKDSIEKFPFRGWSIKNISSAEFLATEKKFRSYNMI